MKASAGLPILKAHQGAADVAAWMCLPNRSTNRIHDLAKAQRMTLTDLLLSVLPTVAVFAFAGVLVRRTGAFDQREHRERVEQLLERIAVAVERGKV